MPGGAFGPDEWTAREDLKHYSWALRRSIGRYLQLLHEQIESIRLRLPIGGYTLDQQKLNSEVSSVEIALLRDANDLMLALRSDQLPSHFRGRSLGSLQKPIRHVRNIREHWKDNRRFWAEGVPIPPKPAMGRDTYASARWFKAQFPDKTPWSASWARDYRAVICGIIPVSELLLSWMSLMR
jgi:hypothetical protein